YDQSTPKAGGTSADGEAVTAGHARGAVQANCAGAGAKGTGAADCEIATGLGIAGNTAQGTGCGDIECVRLQIERAGTVTDCRIGGTRRVYGGCAGCSQAAAQRAQ